MTVWPPCGCGQYRLHPDAQSCLELQYMDTVTPAQRLLDGVIEVGSPSDVTFSGYPNEGDECPCACHGAEE